MPLFSVRVLHEHSSDPELSRRLHDIEFMLQNVMQRMKNIAHGQARIEAEIAGMKDEMTEGIARIKEEQDVNNSEPSG